MFLKFHPFSNKNQLGYYSVGAYCTYSKIDAIEVGNKTGHKVEWHFNNEVFDNFSWHQEPESSLWDLYTLRAQQLREKYDYLVLMYSGGADSHNILNVFVRNGIHLDEIAQYVNYDATRDKQNFWNAEVFNVAAPVTAEVIDQYKLKTHHRIVDLSQQITTIDKYQSDLNSWIYGKNSNPSINARVLTTMRHRVPEYQTLMDTGKKVGFVWGGDKPPLATVFSPTTPDVLYPALMFKDTVDSCFNLMDQVEDNDWVNDELFYWHPDCASMIAKQAHIVSKFMSKVTHDNAFLSTAKKNSVAKIFNQQFYFLTDHGLNQLIYPYWDPGTFSVGKPTSQIIGQRDKWLFEDNNHIKNMMLNTIRETQHRIRDKWTNMKTGAPLYYSPAYLLGQAPLDAAPFDPGLKATMSTSYIRQKL